MAVRLLLRRYSSRFHHRTSSSSYYYPTENMTMKNILKSNKCMEVNPEKSSRTKSIISLLKSESDPNKILSICKPLIYNNNISHLDRLALSIAISSLSSSKSFSTIRSLLSSLPIHHSIIFYGEANMIPDAISTFHSHNTNNNNIQSFNALLFACIVSNNHNLVPTLFRDYPSRYRITPDLVSYNTLLKSFCQSKGSSLSSYSVFDEMLRKGIKPNLTSFAIALSGLYRDENLQHVEKLLLLMKKNGCKPGLSIYNVRIQSLCKLKRVDEAKDLLCKEMRRKGLKPNWVSYGHLILGFCSIGDLEEAKSLYKEMVKKGYVPGSSSSYFTLIYYLCKGEDFDFALQVCKDCMARDWVPCFSTMKELVLGLAGISKNDDAWELISMVKEKFPSDCAQRWTEVEQVLAASQLYMQCKR